MPEDTDSRLLALALLLAVPGPAPAASTAPLEPLSYSQAYFCHACPTSPVAVRIELIWADSEVDLDLHVHVPQEPPELLVDWRRRSSRGGFRTGSLDCDLPLDQERGIPGCLGSMETFYVVGVADRPYRFAVHYYGGPSNDPIPWQVRVTLAGRQEIRCDGEVARRAEGAAEVSYAAYLRDGQPASPRWSPVFVLEPPLGEDEAVSIPGCRAAETGGRS